MNTKSTKHNGLEPFTGEDQTICQPLPESIIEGTKPTPLPFSECRSTIRRFLTDSKTGFSHSPAASRLWVIKAWAMAYNFPIYVTGDSHTGWHSRLVSSHDEMNEQEMFSFLYHERVSISWDQEYSIISISASGNAFVFPTAAPFGLRQRNEAMRRGLHTLRWAIIRMQNPNITDWSLL